MQRLERRCTPGPLARRSVGLGNMYKLARTPRNRTARPSISHPRLSDIESVEDSTRVVAGIIGDGPGIPSGGMTRFETGIETPLRTDGNQAEATRARRARSPRGVSRSAPLTGRLFESFGVTCGSQRRPMDGRIGVPGTVRSVRDAGSRRRPSVRVRRPSSVFMPGPRYDGRQEKTDTTSVVVRSRARWGDRPVGGELPLPRDPAVPEGED